MPHADKLKPLTSHILRSLSPAIVHANITASLDHTRFIRNGTPDTMVEAIYVLRGIRRGPHKLKAARS
jgi:hypothetical protein